MLLNKVAFVFALQVGTPVHGKFEFFAAFLEYSDAFGVCEPHKAVGKHAFEAGNQFGVIHLLKEFNVVAAVVKCVAHTVLDEFLGEFHVVFYFIECHFRLYHPEFRQVTRGV